ncbi:unnamed protein product [Periconia digitata]|uniref:RING-type domain-containing protein n=1 Tax=Periconia digitata TaxID=1303443 RepID=A0A9W4U9Y9_9PLEO|nr:unnamed protein product [Periconia digitata]
MSDHPQENSPPVDQSGDDIPRQQTPETPDSVAIHSTEMTTSSGISATESVPTSGAFNHGYVNDIRIGDDVMFSVMQVQGNLLRLLSEAPNALFQSLEMQELQAINFIDGLEVATLRDDEIGTKCPCCLEEYGEGHHPVRTTCGHVFGRRCLVEWVEIRMDNSRLCPLCRTPFVQSAGADHAV